MSSLTLTSYWTISTWNSCEVSYLRYLHPNSFFSFFLVRKHSDSSLNHSLQQANIFNKKKTFSSVLSAPPLSGFEINRRTLINYIVLENEKRLNGCCGGEESFKTQQQKPKKRFFSSSEVFVSSTNWNFFLFPLKCVCLAEDFAVFRSSINYEVCVLVKRLWEKRAIRGNARRRNYFLKMWNVNAKLVVVWWAWSGQTG